MTHCNPAISPWQSKKAFGIQPDNSFVFDNALKAANIDDFSSVMSDNDVSQITGRAPWRGAAGFPPRGGAQSIAGLLLARTSLRSPQPGSPLAPPWRPGFRRARRPGPHGVWVASGEFWPDTAGHRHSWDGLPTRGANRASGARRATHRTASSVTLALRRATTAKRPAGTFPPRHRNGLSGSRPGHVELRSPAEFSRSLPRPRSAGGFTARSRTCPSTCWRPGGRWRGTG